jgi:hypothetical protein
MRRVAGHLRLVSQRDHGVGACGTVRGDGAGNERDECYQSCDHSHFLDPLHHCHRFLLFIRFRKIRLTRSNSAANRGNSEIIRSTNRQRND